MCIRDSYNAKLTNWAEIDGTIAKPLGTSLRTPATYDWMWTGFVPDDESKIGTCLLYTSRCV